MERRIAGLLIGLWFAWLAIAVPNAALAAEKTYVVKSPDGTEIAVQEAGDPAGRPIVFVHGLLGSHMSWENQLGSNELSGYRLITFDLRGHGLSGRPGDAEAYRDGRRWARDLHAVLESTRAEKPVLVGWSLGAVVITNYVATYGDDEIGGLFYVGGVIELKPDLITAHPAVYAGLASDDLKTHLGAVREFVALCFATQPDQLTFEQLLSNAAMASWTMTRTVPIMSVLAADALPKVNVPMMMLYGEKDSLVRARPSIKHALALNPAIGTKIYENSGHSPFLEEPQRFNRDLAVFRASIPAH